MDRKNTFSAVLLKFTLNMFFYFSSSFPIFKDIRHPELGPFFQGDIIGHPLDRNGIPNEIFRWQKGIYKFHVSDDYSFNEMMLIYQAILEVSTRTCLSVDELLETNWFDSHAYYTPIENYCASAVGCVGMRQDIHLGIGCFSFGHVTPTHETLHALGFYHEQCREDRDEYVSIDIDNVWPQERHNFAIMPSNTYGLPYDYGSIVHYPEYAFALDPNRKTIHVLKEGFEIGNAERLSDSDIKKVNLMYKEQCAARIGLKAFEAYL